MTQARNPFTRKRGKGIYYEEIFPYADAPRFFIFVLILHSFRMQAGHNAGGAGRLCWVRYLKVAYMVEILFAALLHSNQELG